MVKRGWMVFGTGLVLVLGLLYQLDSAATAPFSLSESIYPVDMGHSEERLPIAEDRGSAALAQALLRLRVVGSLLLIAAHPDDENNALLSYINRGLLVRTAYLSLTRGEGGQNLIGSELYQGIGIIRTGELLAARRYDGAQQFFTRAFDFGYSKRAEEALDKWGREEILSDIVRIIRRFRPDVVISTFAGNRFDGHGQHQAAGLLAREAFVAAGDPNRFPEYLRAGLRPWQPKKLYVNNVRSFPPEQITLEIDTGTFVPLFGRSFTELGLAGRSLHRSQDMGTIQRKGPNPTQLVLVDTVLPEGTPNTPKPPNQVTVTGLYTPQAGLFDGIDLSLLRIAALAGAEASKVAFLTSALKEIDHQAAMAQEVFDPYQPAATVPHLLAGLTMLRDLRRDIQKSALTPSTKAEILFQLDNQTRDFLTALRLALGLAFDVLAEDEAVIPGQTFGITTAFMNRSLRNAPTPIVFNLNVPPGWSVRHEGAQDWPGVRYNETAQAQFRVTVAADAAFTRPYWHRLSPHDARVVVAADSLIGLPWAPPPVTATVVFKVGQLMIPWTKPVLFRRLDKSFGAIYRPLQVVPALSIRLSPEQGIVPLQRKSKRTFTVHLRNNVPAGGKGMIYLELPRGWQAKPPRMAFRFSKEDQEQTVRFQVAVPKLKQTGTFTIKARADYQGQTFSQGYEVIDYPHIQPRYLYQPAESRLQTVAIKVAKGLKIGYIMGAGDGIPAALRQVGVAVDLLESEALAAADLSHYDAILAGIRAYETRPDLVANNQRLLDYVYNGGTYIVQYNKYEFNRGQYGPYPLQINRPHDRVTDENAPVTLLEPDHPLFNKPNRITPADFEGWIQERGLYFLGRWDDHYRPLMASHDPGEDPKGGGLVEARYGKGRYIYTGYAWFRQLPAGVPGAYRLFANLISLPKTAK